MCSRFNEFCIKNCVSSNILGVYISDAYILLFLYCGRKIVAPVRCFARVVIVNFAHTCPKKIAFLVFITCSSSRSSLLASIKVLSFEILVSSAVAVLRTSLLVSYFQTVTSVL